MRGRTWSRVGCSGSRSPPSREELLDPPGDPRRQHDLTRDLPDGRLDRFSVSRYDAGSQLLAMRLFYELYGASGALEEKRSHGPDDPGDGAMT